MVHHVQVPGTEVDRVISPTSLNEAIEALARPHHRPIAGGTDLLVELARGDHGDIDTLVDLSRIPGLDRIDRHDATVTIGPMVTHNQVVADPVLRRVAGPLVQACREIGSPQLRNRATVVGNVVTASPANDTISALVALDATVEVASVAGRRRIPIGAFHPGIRRTALEPGELVTGVSFTGLSAPWRGLFLKLGNRRAQAISVIHLAIVGRLASPGPAGPDAGPPRFDEVRLALGSVAPTVIRAEGAEALLRGAPLDDDLIDRVAAATAAGVEPIGDVRATARYRSRLVDEMVRRALVAMRDGDPSDPVVGLVDEHPVLLRTPRSAPADRSDHHEADGPTRAGAGPVEHRIDTPVSAIVNGTPLSERRGSGTLLDWLRRAGLTGTKEGCAEGECGACTVHLDGAAVLSCLVPPSRAHGAEVVTVEGLAPDGVPVTLHRLQEAFVETGAVQCGYCIPGFLVSGAKLLEERPDPSDAEVVDGLAGNLCRCTGYYKIIEAFRRCRSQTSSSEED